MAERCQLWVNRFCDGECLPLLLESRKVKKVLYVALLVTFEEDYRGGDDDGSGAGAGAAGGSSVHSAMTSPGRADSGRSK